MPWRILAAFAAVGVTGGAVLGFLRGLRYLPTLPFAVIEGAALIGLPMGLLGLFLTGIWSLGATIGRLCR